MYTKVYFVPQASTATGKMALAVGAGTGFAEAAIPPLCIMESLSAQRGVVRILGQISVPPVFCGMTKSSVVHEAIHGKEEAVED